MLKSRVSHCPNRMPETRSTISPRNSSTITLWLAAASIFVLLFSAACGPKTKVVTEPEIVDFQAESFVKNAEKMARYGQYKTSNFFYGRAIDRYEKNKKWEKAIQCYIKMGHNYQKLEKHHIALGSLNQALKISRNHMGYSNLELAQSYKKVGYKYLKDGKTKKALEAYRKALTIQLETLGENHPEVAKTYNSIALVQWNNKDSVDANKSYIRSYSIKLRQYQGVPKDIEKKYKRLDAAKYKKGEFENARKHFSRSMQEYIKKNGQNKPLFAKLYERIGILYAFEGDYDNALDFIRKGFDIRVEIYGDHSSETSIGHLNIGICLRLKGDFENARKFLDIALRIKRDLQEEYLPETSDIYYQMGLTCYQEGEQGGINTALDFYQKALIALVPDFEDTRISANPSLNTIFPKDKLLDILIAKAEAQKMAYMKKIEETDQLYDSYETYHLLCQLVERMRRSYKSESYKLFFGEKTYQVFKEAIQAALLLYGETGDEKFKREAFILSEKSKAGVLFEALSEAKARAFAGIPKELLDKEKQLKEELTYCDTYLQKEYQKKNDINQEKIKNLKSRYYTLMLEYRQLIDRFETDYKKYYQLKYQEHIVDIAKLQASLPPDSALVEYFIGDYTLYMFVMTKDNLDVIDTPLDEDLEKQVHTYYNAIKKIEERPFLTLSWELYRRLVEPVMNLVEIKKKLIIIPDGPLYYVPFESLNAGGGTGSSDLSKLDYLIKHFSFSYHYSANLWLHSKQINHPVMKKENAFIGFAPVFGDDNRKGYILAHDPNSPPNPNMMIMRDAERGPEELSQLPATEEEVRSIISLFKQEAKKAHGYFHKKASEQNFKSAGAQGFNLIHVATHSLKDEGQHQLSGLVFSSPDDNKQTTPPTPNKEDGILYSGEIYNLDIEAKLVVLSSCESGVGKLIKGEGMMALNRGFFYSGIQNIIFSLWKVEDRSTSKLMIAFYRNVLKGLPFSRALRKAKLEMIKDRFTAFPKYWGGFVLVGN